MSRMRISTTVDAGNLTEARRRLGTSDSEIVDRALALLLDAVEAAREREILTRQPYEDDPELAWQAPVGPGLAYDGEVPERVLELARRRREARQP